MRKLAIVLILAIAAVGLPPPRPAISTPVATDETTYQLYGRVFPDPQGCQAGTPGHSPWAKGNVCAVDFLQFSELEQGMLFLESLFPSYIEFYALHERFACNGKPVVDPDKGCRDFLSAGLPVTASENGPITRDRAPLYMVRVTDESVPDKNKRWFVFPLSIHGIERAGVEGGTRAIEDLATWALCEDEPQTAICANEQPIPHPLLEATPDRSVTAGDALKRSVIYFIYPNPDGWLRGERTTGTQFYQRYNGNGVDLNRDWPEQGFTFRPYTPWSEPEGLAFGKVLQAIGPKDDEGNPKWTGGIDLHGQLIDRAFSFTLIGGSERPYDKNQRVLQTVKGAWRDAEARLAWSPLIKPNDAPENDERMYGVQWGTIWDTIAYTVTGALGNWIDSPMGLNADGIDNEMSLSHVSNCGIGSCWAPDVEQLHVDGNKSLIYAMINYSLKPEDNRFRTKGKVGYVFNRGFVKGKGTKRKRPAGYQKLPTQDDIDDVALNPTNDYTYEFDVEGPKDRIYNGGIAVTITCAGIQGVSPCALDEARIERREPQEENVQGEEWEVVNSYFNQSPLYVQGGQALHANFPAPGRYRIRILGGGPGGSGAAGVYSSAIDFTKDPAWPDPGQVGYKVSSMRFWSDLKPFTRPRIGKLTVRDITGTRRWMRRYDTIVVTNRVYPRLAGRLKKWVSRFDGNLVLTDAALGMLHEMKIVAEESQSLNAYAGYVNFATEDRDVTYDDPLARKIDQPGAAEGMSTGETHRRQTYEPVPIGYAIQTPQGGDLSTSPVWFVSAAALADGAGNARAVATSGSTANVSYGEVKYKGGRIRFIGALLPDPTEEFDHTFGLANYALTYSGYQMLLNALTYRS